MPDCGRCFDTALTGGPLCGRCQSWDDHWSSLTPDQQREEQAHMDLHVASTEGI